MKKLHLLSSVALIAMMATTSSIAWAEDPGSEGGDEYSDAVDWDVMRTTERSQLDQDGGAVGDMTAPGYNPNALRPAGDGLGQHQATRDIRMDGNNLTGVNEITGVSRIVGNGVLVIENLDYPIDDTQAANKFYVDTKIREAAEDLEDSVSDTQDGLDNLTGGDGIDRNGDSFEVDGTVVRTFGDQNIGGVKNFQTRINISSDSNRPFDSRSHAADGIGVYGRSTAPGGGFGVAGLTDGDGGAGVLGLASGENGRGGNFEATADNGTGIFAMTTGQDGQAAMFRAYDGASTSVAIVGWEDGDNLLTFGVDQTPSGTFTPDGAIISHDGGIRLTGLAAPVDGSDAASKDYVDGMVAAGGGGGDQNLTSVLTEGNNAGGIEIVGLPDPTAGSGAATKDYVDNAVSGLGGSQDLLSVLNEGNNAGGNLIRGLSAPVNDGDAANKKYVDDAIDDLALSGGSDNLGNHIATQSLEMSGYAIRDVNNTLFNQTNGGGIRIGTNSGYEDVNISIVGNPGDAGTSMTTYIDDNDLDSWRIRTHEGESNFENALRLQFNERALYLYGAKVLTEANLSEQELNFDNDRDGATITSPGGFTLNQYTTAIRSEASGRISSSMSFSATGELSTGILGFAQAEDSTAFSGVSSGPGAYAGRFSAVGNDGSPYSAPQTAVYAALRSDVASGSIAAEIRTVAEDTTALSVNTGTSDAKIASFSVGTNEAMSIVPNGTAARFIGYNASGDQTVDINSHSGTLNLSGNSAGGLTVTQPSSTPKATLTRTGSTFGNSHIRYATTDGTNTSAIVAGMGTAGRFTIGTGNDLSYASTGVFEVYADTGDLRWKGTATGTVSTPSDANLKENVTDIVNALEKLSQLRPVEYDLKADGAHNYGVIAQELQAIYPEMVNVGSDGIMSVEYQQLIAPMLSALLEMDARITALENQ